MKINVGLNTKSIKNAIKALKNEQKRLQAQMLSDLLKGCAKWFIERANDYVMLSDIGANVKLGITAEWQVDLQGNTVVIKNTHDKAVYVEFGVGSVGASSPHETASEAGYQYDIFSIFKDPEGAWQFMTREDDLDLPTNAIINRYDSGSDIIIRTMGAKGVAYAYNALIDLHDYGAKEVWEQIKKKYWG